MSQDRSGPTPLGPLRCEPTEAVPPLAGLQVERPGLPQGPGLSRFPVSLSRRWRLSLACAASGPGRSVLRPRPHAARRAPAGRSSAQRPATARACVEPGDPGRAAALRAVQHARRDAADDGAGPPGRRRSPRAGSQAPVQAAAARPPSGWSTSCSRSAGPLFDEHRAAGRPLVLATTTPYDLVKPLADLLGFDDVVATRYGVTDDGTYDGTIDGPFVWAPGKLAAVRDWADDARRRPREQLRLLRQRLRHAAAVGGRPSRCGQPRPRGCVVVAVGPPLADAPPRRARRRPEGSLSASSRSKLAMAFTRPGARARTPASTSPGVEHIPSRGPAILVAQPPQLLRRRRDGDAVARQGGPARALPRQEGGVRRAARRSAREGLRRHPRRSGHRLATSR